MPDGRYCLAGIQWQYLLYRDSLCLYFLYHNPAGVCKSALLWYHTYRYGSGSSCQIPSLSIHLEDRLIRYIPLIILYCCIRRHYIYPDSSALPILYFGFIRNHLNPRYWNIRFHSNPAFCCPFFLLSARYCDHSRSFMHCWNFPAGIHCGDIGIRALIYHFPAGGNFWTDLYIQLCVLPLI